MENEFLTPEAPEPAKKNTFGQKAPAVQTEDTEQLNMLAARLRIGEERNSEVRKKLLFMEQNMLTNHKKAMAEIKSLQTDMLEQKRVIQAIEDKIITIIKELRMTANKEDIDIMKKYIDLWNPITFVTREQLEKILDERLNKKEQPPRYDSP